MVKHQHQHRLVMILVTVAAGMFFSLGGLIGRSVAARGTPEQPPAPSDKDNPTDDLQRSIRLDTYRLDADSGAARGENIYFYKCWMCHNKYAESAPYLK